MKLFWKERSNANGGKMESCNSIKDGNDWKEYFEDPYNIDTQEQVAVHVWL